VPPPSSRLSTARRALSAGLLLLALWVQSVAPGLALHAATSVDPLRDPVICGHVPGANVADEAPPPAGSRCKACPFCTVGPASPPIASAPQPSRALRWSIVTWPLPPPPASQPAPHRTAQPRGPPAPI